MRRHPADTPQAPGYFRGEISFDAPSLHGHRFPLVEVHGRLSGPHLCVMAGVHVNEVSSIEAAIRLPAHCPPDALRGTLSLIPVINQPGFYEYTQYNCPVDGKNILFHFPGRPDGTFSEALCHALLFEWAHDADVLVDMHGGDLRENVSKFVMYQRTGQGDTDRRHEALARCFDADLVVGLDPGDTDRPGRSFTARAKFGQAGVMSEAGANGIIDEESVLYHLNGILNIARYLGMLSGAPQPAKREQHLCDRYVWVPCPVDGLFYPIVEPARRVTRGQKLGEIRDIHGRSLGDLVAPETGYVLWRMTHPVLREGAFALAIAVPAASS
jgi:uncharacterized protein